jgi:hypothetical protein
MGDLCTCHLILREEPDANLLKYISEAVPASHEGLAWEFNDVNYGEPFHNIHRYLIDHEKTAAWQNAPGGTYPAGVQVYLAGKVISHAIDQDMDEVLIPVNKIWDGDYVAQANLTQRTWHECLAAALAAEVKPPCYVYYICCAWGPDLEEGTFAEHYTASSVEDAICQCWDAMNKDSLFYTDADAPRTEYPVVDSYRLLDSTYGKLLSEVMNTTPDQSLAATIRSYLYG